MDTFFVEEDFKFIFKAINFPQVFYLLINFPIFDQCKISLFLQESTVRKSLKLLSGNLILPILWNTPLKKINWLKRCCSAVREGLGKLPAPEFLQERSMKKTDPPLKMVSHTIFSNLMPRRITR